MCWIHYYHDFTIMLYRTNSLPLLIDTTTLTPCIPNCFQTYTLINAISYIKIILILKTQCIYMFLTSINHFQKSYPLLPLHLFTKVWYYEVSCLFVCFFPISHNFCLCQIHYYPDFAITIHQINSPSHDNPFKKLLYSTLDFNIRRRIHGRKRYLAKERNV